jgi:adenine deaminase
MKLETNLVDIHTQTIYPVALTLKGNRIERIEKIEKKCATYILPGFIDAHIHIESSMLIPSEFAKIALTHGSVATVSDPHEIANVLGIKGVDFMINNAKESDFKFYFGASPCVPATPFETSGATLSPQEIETLLQREDIYYLSEVMNFPGVINDDADMLEKIALAKKYNKPIDGHAPALSGDGLQKYIDAGVQTDHEAFSYEEAKEKLQRGMKIQIRQGSAAKNYEALHPLIDEYYENLMFCSDDKHPNDLVKGHINELVKQALRDGHELFKVLHVASLNPVKHYNLDVGLLREGDKADFIEVENLEDFTLIRSFIEGKVVFENGKPLTPTIQVEHINNFHTKQKTSEDFSLHVKCQEYRVIDAINSQLITKEEHTPLKIVENVVQPDSEKDILIISVTNRYANTPPALSFVHGFHLSQGAIASSVAHDSHNIIAVGCDVKSVTQAVNAIIASQGGVCAVDAKGTLHHLPLPIAGLMSDTDGFEVAKKYEALDRFVKEQLHSTLDAPFMTLSFMALLVIPDIKLSDKGLFDGNSFHFIEECIL